MASPSSTTIYTLTITDANGCTDTDDVSVSVSTSGIAPVADFIAEPTIVCASSTVSFVNLSTNTNASTQWNWVFNGANPSGSTDQNPQNILYLNTSSDTLVYTVVLTVTTPNGSDSEIKIGYIHVLPENDSLCTVGISEIQLLSSVIISPNPSKGSFIVQASGLEAETNLQLFNTLGQVIWQDSAKAGQLSKGKEVNVSNLNKGIYFMHFSTQSGRTTKKLLIE
jgi:PKD repeat protein